MIHIQKLIQFFGLRFLHHLNFLGAYEHTVVRWSTWTNLQIKAREAYEINCYRHQDTYIYVHVLSVIGKFYISF